MFGPMGLEGSAVPASENPGEHGWWGRRKAGRLAGLLHPICPGDYFAHY